MIKQLENKTHLHTSLLYASAAHVESEKAGGTGTGWGWGGQLHSLSLPVASVPAAHLCTERRSGSFLAAGTDWCTSSLRPGSQGAAPLPVLSSPQHATCSSLSLHLCTLSSSPQQSLFLAVCLSPTRGLPCLLQLVWQSPWPSLAPAMPTCACVSVWGCALSHDSGSWMWHMLSTGRGHIQTHAMSRFNGILISQMRKPHPGGGCEGPGQGQTEADSRHPAGPPGHRPALWLCEVIQEPAAGSVHCGLLIASLRHWSLPLFSLPPGSGFSPG